MKSLSSILSGRPSRARRTIRFAVPLAAILSLGLVLNVGVNVLYPEREGRILGHGDAQGLKTAYENWRRNYERQGGGPATLRLGLAHSPTLSTAETRARGQLELNLLDGAATVRVRGLAPGAYDLWLVDNRPGAGRGVKPEAGDGFLRVGGLTSADGEEATLSARLERESLFGFNLDLVALTPAGAGPERAVLLAGAPGLMERLYYGDKPWAMGGVGQDLRPMPQAAPFAFLLPKLAYAGDRNQSLEEVLGEQVAKGRELFVQETFDGNGRTCATCHRPDNNHTVDPRYIASLPKDDPLFVAEYDPNLRELEKPELLRKFGLILANADGFDKPGVMRSVPHLRALATSIQTEISKEHGGKGDFVEDEAFVNALGWSGDGSPGTGSLREFAVGAVRQHMTRTLNRREGLDFRFPTDEELTAMEAYQLSLGRTQEVDLKKLVFNSPWVERGKLLFDTKENPVAAGQAVPGETANCNGCHQNAGANSSTTLANPTRDTGVENSPDQGARWIDQTIAWDGGFGQNERHNCGPKADQTCYGNGRFNTPSLIEAADTGPYFHNNSVNTLEEAVAFYRDDVFNRSPGSLTSSGRDRRVKLESSQVVAVALFLRGINELENIRSSNALDDQAASLNLRDGREVVRLAMADTGDAIRVIREGALIPHPDALNKLEDALEFERKAQKALLPATRNALLAKAKAAKLEAKGIIATETP